MKMRITKANVCLKRYHDGVYTLFVWSTAQQAYQNVKFASDYAANDQAQWLREAWNTKLQKYTRMVQYAS